MKKSKFNIRRTVDLEQWGKITARAGALNNICIALYESAEFNKRQEDYATADLRLRQRDQIYNALATTGFYKD